MGPFDPNQLLSSIFGGKALGAAAPIYNPGASNFQMGGLLGDQTQPAQQMIQQGPSLPYGSIEDLIGRPQEQGQELAQQVTANDVAGIPSLQGMAQQQGQAIGDPGMGQAQESGGFGQKLGGFFGNLDQNLQSPSKVLGLGLLSQIDPRLAQGGLLAGGLFGKNKLF